MEDARAELRKSVNDCTPEQVEANEAGVLHPTQMVLVDKHRRAYIRVSCFLALLILVGYIIPLIVIEPKSRVVYALIFGPLAAMAAITIALMTSYVARLKHRAISVCSHTKILEGTCSPGYGEGLGPIHQRWVGTRSSGTEP